jgi:hypothetical protein
MQIVPHHWTTSGNFLVTTHAPWVKLLLVFWPFPKSIYTNSWRRVSHGRKEGGDSDKRESGRGTPWRMPKNGAIRIWLKTKHSTQNYTHNKHPTQNENTTVTATII